MIAEPYICIKGPNAGEIAWWFGYEELYKQEGWWLYADFERETLKALRCQCFTICLESHEDYGYRLRLIGKNYCSRITTGYSCCDYANASESSRLLKRAEFLKAVCEKEGVEWLPAEKPESCIGCGVGSIKCCGCFEGTPGPCNDVEHCRCDCHKLHQSRKVEERPEPLRLNSDPKMEQLARDLVNTPTEDEVAFRKELLDFLEKEFQTLRKTSHNGWSWRLERLRRRFT